jgi:hypothetical protein
MARRSPGWADFGRATPSLRHPIPTTSATARAASAKVATPARLPGRSPAAAVACTGSVVTAWASSRARTACGGVRPHHAGPAITPHFDRAARHRRV